MAAYLSHDPSGGAEFYNRCSHGHPWNPPFALDVWAEFSIFDTADILSCDGEHRLRLGQDRRFFPLCPEIAPE